MTFLINEPVFLIIVSVLLRHQHAYPNTPLDVDNLQAFKAATLASENVDAGAIPEDIFQCVVSCV
jgi:hypothetical protein